MESLMWSHMCTMGGSVCPFLYQLVESWCLYKISLLIFWTQHHTPANKVIYRWERGESPILCECGLLRHWLGESRIGERTWKIIFGVLKSSWFWVSCIWDIIQLWCGEEHVASGISWYSSSQVVSASRVPITKCLVIYLSTEIKNFDKWRSLFDNQEGGTRAWEAVQQSALKELLWGL